jgi:hypothetical protein
VITEVGPAGEIIEPEATVGRFHNAIGAVVRDELNSAIPTWKEVPEETKRALWERKLLVNFRFPEGSLPWVKHAALKQMGVIPMLEVGPQQEVYPKGVNPLPRVRPHNSLSMG